MQLKMPMIIVRTQRSSNIFPLVRKLNDMYNYFFLTVSMEVLVY